MGQFSLTIECRKDTQARCYTQTTYKIISFQRLKRSQLQALFDAGLLGSGQQHSFAAITSLNKRVPIPDDDDWKALKNIKPTSEEGLFGNLCYEYECVTRCDSGD